MHRFFDQTDSQVVGRFSRRALFVGAIASVPGIAATAASGAVSPLPSSSELPETSCARVRRLAGELSDAMKEVHGGEWRVQIDHQAGFALVVGWPS